MPQEDEQPSALPARRRRIIRRGGFAGSNSGEARGFREPDYADEVEDAVNPEAVEARLRSNVPMLPGPGPTPEQARENPASRLRAVNNAGSSAYAMEYRLTMLHRLLIRNIPLDVIAQQLGVSITTVERDRVRLKQRLREAAKTLDINEMVGDQGAFYDEIAGTAMQVASDGKTPTPMRLAALRTAASAKNDKSRFYTSAGVFDVLKYKRAGSESEVSDIQLLMEKTERMFERLVGEPSLAEPPPALKGPKRRIKRADGFKALAMEDAEADSNSHEMVEL